MLCDRAGDVRCDSCFPSPTSFRSSRASPFRRSINPELRLEIQIANTISAWMSLRNCWKPKMGHIPMCSECNTLCIAILPLQTLRWIAFALGRIAFASGSLNLPSGPAIRFRLCLCSRNPTLKHRSLVDATMTENRGSGAGMGGAHGPIFGAGPPRPPSE